MIIPATLQLAAAGQRLWDAVVVGAGPAGALAAHQLAQRGLAVLLVDKAEFPRWKVCGACLNRRSLAALAGVGLGDLSGRLEAVPLDRLLLAAGGKTASVSLPGSVALSRTALDAALVRASLEAGAQFLPATQARLGVPQSSVRLVTLAHAGQEVETAARVILAADGLGGGLLAHEPRFVRHTEPHSYVGAGAVAAGSVASYRAGTIYMACAARGYLGVVRLEDGRLNCAAALDPIFIRQNGDLGSAAASILAEAGLAALPGMTELAWRGTPLLTRRVSSPAAERVFVLGDAAGYVEPFTGEGIAWALAAAVAVGPLAHQACARWEPALTRQWASVHRRVLGRHPWVCRAVTEGLRRPRLLRVVLALLRRLPGAAAPLVQYLSG
jgi:flavin-dependent dehydrogenase